MLFRSTDSVITTFPEMSHQSDSSLEKSGKKTTKTFDPCDKFTKDLMDRMSRNSEETCCEICCEGTASFLLSVTHLWDVACEAEMHEYSSRVKQADKFPNSVHEISNGVLLCPNCQISLDHDLRPARITAEGIVEVDQSLVSSKHRLNGQRTLLADHLGEPNYPTAEFLAAVYSAHVPKPGKRGRELINTHLNALQESGLSRRSREEECRALFDYCDYSKNADPDLILPDFPLEWVHCYLDDAVKSKVRYITS